MGAYGWVILVVLASGVILSLVAFILLRVIRQEIKLSQDNFLQMAQQQYSLEQNKAAGELETRRQAVETTVKGLKDELEKYQQLIHEFEKDRASKYGNLENELKNASNATQKLQETTTHLNNILGNVKLRGQWGERMAEDIIHYAGLIEGINYIKQKKQDSVNTKPDFTFLLPNESRINMDVKFPLDNYTNMVNTQDQSQKLIFEKEFVKNVKERIKEIQSRDYINPAENTLDFVILFIPNEQVYGLIQEKMPGLLDNALTQKVVMCSPFTLYAMLSVIRQAHENFRYEKDIRKIVVLIEQFVKSYQTFKARFEGIGNSIEKLERQYADIKGKSFKQIDTKIKRIDDYKKGKNLVGSAEEDMIKISAEDVEDQTIV